MTGRLLFMCEHDDIINLILTQINPDKGLLESNYAQVECAVDLLVDANIPFNLVFSECTDSHPAGFSITVQISPTMTISFSYSLGEGCSQL